MTQFSQDLGPIGQQMYEKLMQADEIDSVVIQDQSSMHIGHAGYNENGESHFLIVIRSDILKSFRPLDRHRKVLNILGSEVVSKTHAISFKFEGA